MGGKQEKREKDCRGRYLPEVSDVEQIEGVEQVDLLHGEHHVAGGEERTDVLQAQELQRPTAKVSDSLFISTRERDEHFYVLKDRIEWL